MAESSESEPEDDVGEELTPEIDAQIMKTIAAIRTRDQAVYDSNHNFFGGILTRLSYGSVLNYAFR